MSVDSEHVRMAEALLFAASEPLDEATLATRLPDGADIPAVLAVIGVPVLLAFVIGFAQVPYMSPSS